MEQGRSNFTACLERDEKGSLTKRKMLSVINRIFDLLGIAAPVVISGKILGNLRKRFKDGDVGKQYKYFHIIIVFF